MDPASSFLNSESKENFLPPQNRLNTVEIADQIANNADLSQDPKLQEAIILIAKIALPILIAVVFFAAIPFVAEVTAIGLGITGLFLIALGVSFLLTGEGLVRFKKWGEVQQVEADKAKQQKVNLAEQNVDRDDVNSDSDSLTSSSLSQNDI